MLDKLKNRMNSAATQARKTAEEIFDNIKVSKEIQAERIEICNSCEHLYTPTRNCKKCGCFMDVKSWLAPASCPIGKWTAVDPKDQIATSEDS